MGTNRKASRLTRALTLAVSGVLLITAGILAGVVFSKERTPAATLAPVVMPVDAEPEYIMMPSPTAGQPAISPEASPVNLEQDTVSPSCRMQWSTSFTLCGHNRQDSLVERTLIGKTEAEVRAAITGWELDSFKRDELLFSRAIELYCPDHVLLKSAQGGLGVYKTDAETLELQEVMKFEIDLGHLDRETQLLLDQGMPFADLEEIEGFIENLES